jgi:hypothetical protein
LLVLVSHFVRGTAAEGGRGQLRTLFQPIYVRTFVRRFAAQ